MAPAEAALLAASGPTSPAIAPLPNRSGCWRRTSRPSRPCSEAMVAPAPGITPDREAEQGGPGQGHPRLDPVAQLRPEARLFLVLDDAAGARGVPALVEGVEKLAQAEQADRDRDEVDAADQLGRAEGEALLAGLQIDADGAEREADEPRDDAVAPVAADHDHQAQHAHHGEQEVFGRAEAAGELAEQRCQQGDQDDADRCRRRTRPPPP